MSENVMNWWQREDLCYEAGRLTFGGQAVDDLAGRFGSPSFVYLPKRMAANLQRVKNALDKAGFQGRNTIYYAMKANRFAPILTYLKQTGLCGIDACSPNEVEHAVACGFNPEEISFTATSLSQQDFNTLARYNVFMDCDSITAIHNWGKRKPGANIGIRINPTVGVGRDGNDKLQYAGEKVTKFGIYKEQFAEALDVAKSYGMKVTKIHFHTGCGYLGPQLSQLDTVLQESRWFIDAAKDVKRVNVGGGLGVPHLPFEQKLDLEGWTNILAKHFKDKDIHIEVEPGDYIAKDAGLLILTKTFFEQKKDTFFMGVDAGFNIAPEPAYYNMPFQPVPVKWKGEQLKPVTVVGNINEALDVWYENAWMPDMSEQDHVILINSGAYSSSMSSNHCMRGNFKEFILI